LLERRDNGLGEHLWSPSHGREAKAREYFEEGHRSAGTAVGLRAASERRRAEAHVMNGRTTGMETVLAERDSVECHAMNTMVGTNRRLAGGCPDRLRRTGV
jgi:hypothetical protein